MWIVDNFNKRLEEADKCKFEGNIANFINHGKISSKHYDDITVFLKNNSLIYKFSSFLSPLDEGEEVGSSLFEFHKNIKIGKKMYIIADKSKKYQIIATGKEVYDKYPEVPLCTDNIVELPQENYLENKFIWGGIIIVVLIIGVIFYKIKRNKKQS